MMMKFFQFYDISSGVFFCRFGSVFDKNIWPKISQMTGCKFFSILCVRTYDVMFIIVFSERKWMTNQTINNLNEKQQ